VEGLVWQPAEFDVTCLPATEDDAYNQLVRFPSPVPSGNETNDLVAMEWYAATDRGRRIRAPAVLVVHESGSAMVVGRMFARSLHSRGFHAFLIHLPFYGERRTDGARPEISTFTTVIRQAVADVRRARDAIYVLPHLDSRQIAVQGTSLGGFVVTIGASLDGCFDQVFIMLAGGHLSDLIQNGRRDTAKIRQLLSEAGYTDDKLRELLYPIEPTRIAHRLNPDVTWLYTAQQDQVVPLENAAALATAARLGPQNHVKLIGNHYTVVGHFPRILDEMTNLIRSGVAD
jgi:dienelactone hydrolase